MIQIRRQSMGGPKFAEFVFGNRIQFSMEHRIINAFFAFSLLAGIVFIPLMILRGMPADNTAVLGIVTSMGAVSYYFSRFRGRYRGLVPFIIFLLWFYLIYGWIFAAGVFGTPHYFFILPFLLSVIFYRGMKRNAFIGITLVILLALYTLQYSRPDMIRPYTSAALQTSMKMAGHFINLSMLVFIVGSVISTVDKERARSETLLRNILPEPIAEELKNTSRVEPRHYDSATVLFTDFVGFTSIARDMNAPRLVHALHLYFSRYDEITRAHGLEKLKTIGDAYMCAGGVPRGNKTHALDACLAALELLRFIRLQDREAEFRDKLFPAIRVGVHTGPVTAGIVGRDKFAYDIWGDTVNTASRMESAGRPNMINVSRHTHDLARAYFLFEARGEIAAKGKGNLDMYFLLRLRPEYSADESGSLPNEAYFKAIRSGSHF